MVQKRNVEDIRRGFDLDEFIRIIRPKEHELLTAKEAVHSCVIPTTWIQGQPVPGFEVPKNCIKVKAVLQDVRLNPMNCELQALFIIHMVFGDDAMGFEGWC